MIKIVIIGSGNVAQHLIAAFEKSEAVEIIQVFSRKPNTKIAGIDTYRMVYEFALLKEADLYIIAVSDDAINEVSQQLPFINRLVVHTSGTAPITAIDTKNRKGVFYPLQTFTKNKPVAFETIPICLEAENSTDYRVLSTVAKSISNSVYAINSNQRKALHVAAVFVNNFTNHLFQIGEEICSKNQVPFEILKPLINETVAKISDLKPIDAQTGPAKRNDQTTINAHLDYLTDENHKNIYKIITQSILTNGKKL